MNGFSFVLTEPISTKPTNSMAPGSAVHAALEQDDRHPQTDQFAELPLRQVQRCDAGHRTQHQANGNQDHNGRKFDARGQSLARQSGTQHDQQELGSMHIRRFTSDDRGALSRPVTGRFTGTEPAIVPYYF